MDMSVLISISQTTLTFVFHQADHDMAARCETVLNTTMAEMETYHTQKHEDFSTLTKEHLDGEIAFYEQVSCRLCIIYCAHILGGALSVTIRSWLFRHAAVRFVGAVGEAAVDL